MSMIEAPIFPLNTVLFPGGVLPLRIFEPRYLDMVSDCMKNGTGFAVNLISEGREAGQPAEFRSLGTLTQIVDFDKLDDGFLGITAIGQQPLRVISHTGEDDLARGHRDA